MIRSTSHAVLLIAAGTAAAGPANVRYDVIALDPPAQASVVCPCFFPQALNDANQAAGFFFGTDGTYNAFTTEGDALFDISPSGDNLTFARGINDAGWVVGWTNAFSFQDAFLYDGATLVPLGTLGGTHSDAHDVNEAGQIVGCAATLPDDYGHAAVWEDGTWTDLGTLGGAFSEALAINATGTIAGWAWNDDWDRRAVYWTPDRAGPFELPSFSPPDKHTIANDVNDAGVIVGQVEVDPIDSIPMYRAAMWEDGLVTDLGLLPEAGEGSNEYFQTAHLSTVARAINNVGVIVGMSLPEATIPVLRPGPFVHDDGVMRNLNDLLTPASATWIIRDVSDINDAGVISGYAVVPGDNHAKAVLLVPVALPAGDVNGDLVVGFADLLAVLAAWGPCTDTCLADLDGDGTVGFADALIVLSGWTPG